MHILLIEDEQKTVQSLKQGLEEHSWTIDVALNGNDGLQIALSQSYDVIVSDIMMPGISGLELCKVLREKGYKTPILLISALNQTDDKVLGLEAGADDYLAKPFELKEFIARIKALARRQGDVFKKSNLLVFGDVELNFDTKIALRNNINLKLTPKEFSLLEYFIRNQGRVLSKTEIAEKVWDIDFDTGTNIIEVYVNYLRNKLDKGFDKKLIHTQFGQGYILK
jgi:two-component system, OmpR family, copper resistance phosphate regulon response regulator CusR